MTARPFSLCVYCGARDGALPDYADAARRVGEAVGRRGWQLVYGGGNVGLMGQVADATLKSGGRVVGVIPRTLMEREVGHRGLHEMHVVETMHERKQMMAQRADAFLALPGGLGTMEELFEVWTWRYLGYHDQPIGLLNVRGYWEPLRGFIASTVAQGFVSPAQLELVVSGEDPEALLDQLQQQALRATAPDDYSRI